MRNIWLRAAFVGLFCVAAFAQQEDGCLLPAQAKANPNAPAGLKKLDFMIGEWDVTCRYLQPDGQTYLEGKVHFQAAYVLDGFAIQDFWRQLDPSTPGGELLYGGALRSYNPKTNTWVLHWWDITGIMGPRLEGEFKDGKLFYYPPKGRDMHGEFQDSIIFYDIEPDRFLWRTDRQYIGGPKMTVTFQEYNRIK